MRLTTKTPGSKGPKKTSFKERASGLSLSHEVSGVLLEAHTSLYGHTAKESRNQAWRAVRRLAIYLHEVGIASAQRLPNTILSDFYLWLDTKRLEGATKQSLFNIVRAVLLWCGRNRPKIIDGAIVPEARGFIRQEPRVVAALNEELSRLIIKSCLQDIEEIVSRLDAGWHALKQGVNEEAIVIRRLLEIGNGTFPSQYVITRSGDSLARRVLALGGLRRLWRTLYPSPEDLLPFYLAIQFQLAGNPHAIAQLKKDCILKNPLREDREWVVWEKPRSTRQQRADFSSGKETAAPSLIRKLIKITEPLRELSGSNSELLFICYQRGRVAVPCAQTWHNELQKFIGKYSLLDFDFVQLRKTSAVLHHQTAGSVIAAKEKLNHISVATTVRYTPLSDRHEEHEKLISEGQSDLLKAALAKTIPPEEASSKEEPMPADTVFGFLCKNPLQGYGSVRGSPGPCDHFHRCATCPGAIVPLDQPNVVAALIKSKRSLLKHKERASVEGWIERFNMLYMPTLQVIEENLLPFVAEHVMQKALMQADARPFPELE